MRSLLYTTAGTLVFSAALLAPASAQQGASPTRTRVVLLGTGMPNADPDRWGPATAVVVDDEAYLVDAGPGLVRRAAAAARDKAIDALVPGS